MMGICHQKSKWFGALRHNYWLLHDSVLSVLIIGNVYCVPINSKYLLNVHKYYISKYFDDGSSADTLWFNPKKKIKSNQNYFRTAYSAIHNSE